MVRRQKTDRVQLPIRLRESLRADLEKAAKQAKHSLNAEVVDRLERSVRDELVFGGPEVRGISYLMASAFYHTGRNSSGGKKIDEWIYDPDIYRAAIVGVVDALVSGLPDHSQRLFIEAVTRRILTRQANGGTSNE
jgi:hypothetical protein